MTLLHHLSSLIIQAAILSFTDVRTVLGDVVANTTITQAPNHPVPSSPTTRSYHPVWRSFVVPIVVVAGIVCSVLYLALTCYRKPFGEHIRPRFSRFLLGATPTLEDLLAPAALETDVRDTNSPRVAHDQGRDRPFRNISDMQL